MTGGMKEVTWSIRRGNLGDVNDKGNDPYKKSIYNIPIERVKEVQKMILSERVSPEETGGMDFKVGVRVMCKV